MIDAQELKWLKCPNCDLDHLIYLSGDGNVKAEFGVLEVTPDPEDHVTQIWSFKFWSGDGAECYLMGPTEYAIKTTAVSMVANGAIGPRIQVEEMGNITFAHKRGSN